MKDEQSCLACGRGFHDECEQQPCCCSTDDIRDTGTQLQEDGGGSEWKELPNTNDAATTGGAKKKYTGLRGSGNGSTGRRDVTISAGRKRAAREYEIDESVPCDWRGRANCGGGFIPVVGCIAGFQTARHHGPDKSTTNNGPENVHLICTPCHNLWHRRNDPKYGPDDKCPEGIQKHEPRWATIEELMTREMS